MTVLYYCYFDKRLTDLKFDFFMKLLPEKLQKRIGRFKRWEDAHACLYGRLLLMRALETFKADVTLEDIRYSQYNRPYIDIEGIDFNISHAGCYVLCTITDRGKIGVDVEEIKYISIDDFKNQFTPKEWDCLVDSENELRVFYEIWTKKEAIVKADGRGLNIPLLNVETSGNPVSVASHQFYLSSVDLSDDYQVHMATSYVPEGIQIMRYEM